MPAREIPPEIESELVSPWLARKDADWWVDKLYDFAPALGATIMRTAISRSVIDVNRDPSGKSLYPGQATTELCPTTTFDGEPLYKRRSHPPDSTQIAARRLHYFDPYHAAIADEIARLRGMHERVVLFEAHSIRSPFPRLFDGELPNFNIGTNSGASCAQRIAAHGGSGVQRSRFSLGHQRPLQRRLDDAPLWRAARWACMRSSWSWPAAAIWTIRRRSPKRTGPRLTRNAARRGIAQIASTRILEGCIRFADTGHAYGAAPSLHAGACRTAGSWRCPAPL